MPGQVALVVSCRRELLSLYDISVLFFSIGLMCFVETKDGYRMQQLLTEDAIFMSF